MKNTYLYTACFLLLAGFFLPWSTPAYAQILLEDTVWEGAVQIDENILVPSGVTLTVKGNTIVGINPADSTKTDPEYMSSLTEITIRGALRIQGTPEHPVIFHVDRDENKKTSWAGIIIDGGTGAVSSCTIQDAETGLWVVGGTVDLSHSTLSSNHYGLVVQGKESALHITDSLVTGNQYGMLASADSHITRKNTRITDNRKKDIHPLPADNHKFKLQQYDFAVKGVPLELDDEVLIGDTIWHGHILIRGRVRIPADNRLIILPGTIVEFSKKDTNGDGIGENGLMLQGVLVAKGTPDKPIVWRSAEKNKKKGDWDAINIIGSDGARSIIEYCRFEDAYRGLHFHFSNVAVQHCIFRHNYRGTQFQESTVELRGNQYDNNTSGIQARDSEITFTDNRIVQNIFGANFLRSHLNIDNNSFADNLDFGLKIREGYPTVTENTFYHNRFGLMFSDTTYGSVKGNLILKNGETGLSIRTGTNMEISGNFIQANGLSGIALRDSMAVIQDNHISENGERGIGLISFQGPITHNAIVHNHLYAIAAEDNMPVSAPLNWYGQDDIEILMYDQNDAPGRGRIRYFPVAKEPFPFVWPLTKIEFDLNWYGKISVPKTQDVPSGTTLSIKPGAEILFAKDAGFNVRGKILALGTGNKRISFTAAQGNKPGSWGEILMQYAEGSRFSNCDFEYASWAIHCHFTALPIIGCTFKNNGGGVRFRSGPLLIKNSLFSDNGIGLRAFRAQARITGNSITRNKKGIFVREQGSDLLITGNNIYDNVDYNIWVGDFNTEDVRAPDNWWGPGDPNTKIFDARREPGIGTILYDPPLKAPLDISFVDEEQE